MDTEHDVVVVGAGIMGTSVADHLLSSGVEDLVIADSSEPGAATSGAGAGFVALWAAGQHNFWSADDLKFEEYGIEFYESLGRRASVDYRGNGTLFVATSDEAWETWIGPMAHHPLAPTGVRSLDSNGVGDVTGGVLAAEAVAGGVLQPVGLQMSVGRATRALAEQVSAKGADLRTNCDVKHLLVSDGRVIGVATEAGEIRARQVVLACGAWTNRLLADVGINIPLVRIVATRVVSSPSGVNGSMPTIMVPEWETLWLREHRGGLTYGNHDGYAPLTELGGSLDSPGLPHYPELVERLETALLPKVAKLVPTHDTSISHWLQGTPSMTPDYRFVAGAIPGVDGLHVLAGDNEAGVTHGPGLGRMLAEMVVHGSTEWVDATPYRPERFDLQAFASEAEVNAATPPRR